MISTEEPLTDENIDTINKCVTGNVARRYNDQMTPLETLEEIIVNHDPNEPLETLWAYIIRATKISKMGSTFQDIKNKSYYETLIL